MSLHYELGDRDRVVRLGLIGTIDRDAGDTLDEAWAGALSTFPTAIELDFSAVDYINSTGIALIVGLLVKARAEGALLRAVGLTPHYEHIFKITRLSDHIKVVQPDSE
jgi:anti-sigma B factor antagonist